MSVSDTTKAAKANVAVVFFINNPSPIIRYAGSSRPSGETPGVPSSKPRTGVQMLVGPGAPLTTLQLTWSSSWIPRWELGPLGASHSIPRRTMRHCPKRPAALALSPNSPSSVWCKMNHVYPRRRLVVRNQPPLHRSRGEVSGTEQKPTSRAEGVIASRLRSFQKQLGGRSRVPLRPAAEDSNGEGATQCLARGSYDRSTSHSRRVGLAVGSGAPLSASNEF